MARLVFKNANLLDGDNPARRGQTVVIDGERIVAVGERAPDDLTRQDRVVELDDKTLMPGMITCHYHSTYRDLGAVRAPYGLEHPPAYQALIAAQNLGLALQCGFTGAVGAGCSNDIDASVKRAIGAAFRAQWSRAEHDRSRQRLHSVVLASDGMGRGALLRRAGGVSSCGARRDQARR